MTDGELLFKIILIAVYTAFSIIRIQFQVRAQHAGVKTIIRESKAYSALLALLIVYEVFTLFLFLIAPQSLAWAGLDIPLWFRWIGALLAVGSLALFVWVHVHLGSNFSIDLQINERHTLIESGPYRRIRHPMYTAFYLLHLAAFLITANWFIGLSWVVGLTIIIFLRVKREEKMMLDRFGHRYAEYMKRTGRFLPPWRSFQRQNPD
jgi:protein-S-isoprenylcysteine O-methyltransferase Ste14